MKLTSDIQAYKAACHDHAKVYECITCRVSAVEMRRARWDINRRKREAAENLIMSVMGKHRPALIRAGLLGLYEEMAAGKSSDVVLLRIADETVKAFDK
jgi:hypothetical protein